MKILVCALLALLPLGRAIGQTTAPADDRRGAEALVPVIVKLIGTGQLEQAGKLIGEAETLDPGNDAVQYYKGILLLAGSSSVRDLATACRCFEKAAAADSTNLWYKRRLANLLFVLKQDQRASQLYSAILQKTPFDTEILSSLADVCISMGMYEKADSLLGIVEKVEGPNGITQLSRLELLRQKGDYDAFFAALQNFVAQAPVEPEGKCEILGKFISSSDPHFIVSHLKDYDAVVQRCLDTYPSDTTVCNLAASFYYSLKQYSRAVEVCGENPQSRSLAYMRFASNMMLADYQAAIVDCDRLALMVGTDAALLSEISCNRADCLQYMGRTGAAYREYEKALKLKADNIVALNNYAYLMACEGRNLALCEKMILNVIEKEPENATYLDTYGWILHKRKKDAEAKAVFKKALLYGGKENAEVLLHYAEVLDALGEKSVAEAYREQVKSKK